MTYARCLSPHIAARLLGALFLSLLASNGLAQQPASARNSGQVIAQTPSMIDIAAGTFSMGSASGDPDNQPPLEVTIHRPFAIGQFEVTFDEYAFFAKSTGRPMPKQDNDHRGRYPMTYVSLHDAIAYTQWLSAQNNRKYRLPTEAEWEYVSKAAVSSGDAFKGNSSGKSGSNCKNCGYFWQTSGLQEVGNYKPNRLGLYDIFGNVWEWTCSAYTMEGYVGEQNRCNLDFAKTFSVRGGAWNSDKTLLRSYVRFNNPSFYKGNDTGFRIVEEY